MTIKQLNFQMSWFRRVWNVLPSPRLQLALLDSFMGVHAPYYGEADDLL